MHSCSNLEILYSIGTIGNRWTFCVLYTLWFCLSCLGLPNMWKYPCSAQWRWEMDSASLLAKTGPQLKQLWAAKMGWFNSHRFWTQNAVRVTKPLVRSIFNATSTWKMSVSLSCRNNFYKNVGRTRIRRVVWGRVLINSLVVFWPFLLLQSFFSIYSPTSACITGNSTWSSLD